MSAPLLPPPDVPAASIDTTNPLTIPATDVPTGVTTPEPPVRTWPVWVLAAPAFVAVWSGWVGLGTMTGFGRIQPLPGTPLAGLTLDTAITLPIGVETYAAFAMRVWLAGRGGPRAVAFARRSAVASLLLGAAGQVAYHLMSAAGVYKAPWWITTVVATLPVLVLGMGAALAHLVRHDHSETGADVADNPPDTVRDNSPDTDQDTERTSRRTPSPGGAGRRAVTTADRIARLREQHPDWSTAEIARKAKVSDRTVRRHLPALAATSGPDSTPDVTDAEREAA